MQFRHCVKRSEAIHSAAKRERGCRGLLSSALLLIGNGRQGSDPTNQKPI